MAKPRDPSAIVSISLGALLAAACIAHAADTWRCGNTYSDKPCTGGRTVDVEDARNPTAARENDAQTRRTAAAADRMERDRRKQEQVASRQRPVVFEHKPVANANSGSGSGSGGRKSRKGPKDPAFFTASDAGAAAASTGKKKKKGATAD